VHLWSDWSQKTDFINTSKDLMEDFDQQQIHPKHER